VSACSRSSLSVESDHGIIRVELLDAWQPTVIKGNAGEIGALAESVEVSPIDGFNSS
jgi:hydroxyethylthiazole kinase-like sugar kinase family protein